MLREIAAGLVIGLVVFGLLVACMGGGLSPVVRCKLEALEVLPEDPMQATAYDAVDVIERLQACHREQADGGP
jgi:hypothetical protein